MVNYSMLRFSVALDVEPIRIEEYDIPYTDLTDSHNNYIRRYVHMGEQPDNDHRDGILQSISYNEMKTGYCHYGASLCLWFGYRSLHFCTPTTTRCNNPPTKHNEMNFSYCGRYNDVHTINEEMRIKMTN